MNTSGPWILRRIFDRSTLKSDARILGLGAIPAMLVLAVAFLAHRLTGVEFSHLSSDPQAIAKSPWYLGVISNIGVVIWSATAAICLFTGYVERRARPEAGFLRAAGWLTLILLADDLLMIHEKLAPSIGLNERVVLAGYLAVFGWWMMAFRLQLIERNPLALAAIFGFFGVSILSDQLVSGGYVLEDGAKLLGISTWCAYFTTAAAAHIRHGAQSKDAIPLRIARNTIAGKEIIAARDSQRRAA